MISSLPTAPDMAKRKFWNMRRMEWIFGYTFVLPWIIGFLTFTAIPLIFSLFTSFTNYNITSQMNWVGLQNYFNMFTQDQFYWQSLGNTAYYVLFSVPLNTLGGITLAVMLNKRIPGMRVFRTIYYLPSVLSGVAVYLLWEELLNPSTGYINVILSWVGIHGPAWLYDPAWTKPALILMQLWGLGGGMLLYLNAMKSTPEQLYEAADLDGASAWQKFLHITLPMITPVIFFEMSTGLIGAFQVFQSAYVMTNNGGGGPLNSLLFYNLYMWNEAFVNYQVGYANAMAWILFIIVMIITLVNLGISRYWVHYEGGD